MAKRYDEISSADAEQAIRDYNEGIYSRTGKRNVDIDAEGRDIFNNGIGTTKEEIRRQIYWIKRDYGGVVGEVPQEDYTHLVDVIYGNLPSYKKALYMYMDINDLLVNKVWNILFDPFQSKKVVSKKYLVWSTKFLHFLNPETFPILDWNAARFYGLIRIRNNAHVSKYGKKSLNKEDYILCVSVIREILSGGLNWFDYNKLCRVDGRHYQSDIKLIDKIAYQLGRKGA